MVLAVSLFAGCAHFESIEYSQEISEENPETIEAFDQFINDIFETEVTENTINLHFTISDPEKYGITDYPVTLGDLSNDAMSDSNARLTIYILSRFRHDKHRTENTSEIPIISTTFCQINPSIRTFLAYSYFK